jgi:hypothetical protein
MWKAELAPYKVVSQHLLICVRPALKFRNQIIRSSRVLLVRIVPLTAEGNNIFYVRDVGVLHDLSVTTTENYTRFILIHLGKEH